MSVYNKRADRDVNGRINRLLRCNQINRTKKHASLQHLHFVLIPRHIAKHYCYQIVAGFDVEGMVFNNQAHKPTLCDCCL